MKKMLPLILGALIVGGGFFGYQKFMGGGPTESPVVAQEKAEKLLAENKKKRKKDKLEGPVVSLGDPFVVNLADPGLAAFTKLSVSLKVDVGTPVEVGEGADAAPALEEQPEARDAVISVVGSKTSDEVKSTEGRERMKDEIIEEITQAAPRTIVLEVFFTDFAIQGTG